MRPPQPALTVSQCLGCTAHGIPPAGSLRVLTSGCPDCSLCLGCTVHGIPPAVSTRVLTHLRLSGPPRAAHAVDVDFDFGAAPPGCTLREQQQGGRGSTGPLGSRQGAATPPLGGPASQPCEAELLQLDGPGQRDEAVRAVGLWGGLCDLRGAVHKQGPRARRRGSTAAGWARGSRGRQYMLSAQFWLGVHAERSGAVAG